MRAEDAVWVTLVVVDQAESAEAAFGIGRLKAAIRLDTVAARPAYTMSERPFLLS